MDNNYWFKGKNRNLGLSLILFIFLSGFAILAYFILKEKTVEIDLSRYNVDPSVVIDNLEVNGRSHQYNDKELTLTVDSAYAEQVHSILNANASRFDRVGFEVFDIQEYGVSDFKQKISLIRALQGELEKTILSMDGVIDARVHLVVNNQRFQRKDQDTGKASVFLKLSNDASSNFSNDITDLIMYSVPNLNKSNIKVITNQSGSFNSLSDYPIMHHKIRVEDYYKDKVIELLSSLYSVDKFIVNVDVSVSSEDFQSKSERVIPVEGSGNATRKKERFNESSKGQGKGADKNTIRNVEHEFRTGTTFESIKRSPFSIEKKSFAVLILQDITEDQAQALEMVLEASVGLNKSQGDSIVIKSIPRNPSDG